MSGDGDASVMLADGYGSGVGLSRTVAGSDRPGSAVGAHPLMRLANPANRLAFPYPADGGCGKCGAPAQMFRRIRWFGMRIRFCARCGCDHTTRAGSGTPDECGVRNRDTGEVCGRLQPCPVHGGSGVVSPYGRFGAHRTAGVVPCPFVGAARHGGHSENGF